MFELQVIYRGHFVLPVLNISWICETKMNTIYFSFFRFIVCTHLSLFEAHLAGGSPRPPASYTESRSNSEGWFGCNGPKRARPTGSSSECPYHCFQRTTGQERKLRQGKMRETSCMVSEKWYHFRWPHPVSISIVDGGPFSAVVAESQEVGRHVVTPETRQHVGSMWVCGFFLSVCVCFVSYSFKESRPCVMTPVNSVSRRASNSNQWILSSEFAHHAPPLMSSSSSEPWEPQRPQTHAAVCSF